MGTDDKEGEAGWWCTWFGRPTWHNIKIQDMVGIVAWTALSLRHDFLAVRRPASENLLGRAKGGKVKEIARELFAEKVTLSTMNAVMNRAIKE
jgi:hypothetical protein